VILLHDVYAGAAHAWLNCQHLVRTFELTVDLRADVPAGLAVLRMPRAKVPHGLRVVRSSIVTAGRAAFDDTILHARRAVGRALRHTGLRK
jgi:hypothetical protein